MTIRRILRAHPRLPRLIVTRGLALSFALSGCVPATQWEEASSAAEVEAEGHRRVAERLTKAEADLERAKADNEKLSAAKEALEAQLEKEELQMAQTSMDMESTKKEQEQQVELVTQLRGELARVGDHLESYQGDKDELTVKLAAAETEVAMLETEVQRLRVKAEASAANQEQLRGALKDMESGSDQVGPVEKAPKTAPSTDKQESEAEDAPGADDVPPEEPGEVLPSEQEG